MVRRAKAKTRPKAKKKRTAARVKIPTWDTKMPLPSNPDTGETANDYYILDCEVHVMPEDYRSFIKYFEGTKTFEYAHKMCNWWQWIDHRTGKQAAIHPGMDWHIDKIIGDMNRAGVDQIALMRESFIDTTGDSAPFSTNQHVIDAIEKYPDRVIGVSNVGPFSKRQTKDILWELEYLHDNHNFKFTKFYQPEDCPINDRRLWPVYEMCQDKGIVALFHTGITIRLGPTRYTLPILLDDVASDFPDLKIVAYHGGYPYWEDLVMLMWKHPNLFVSYSILLPWLMRAAPLRPHGGHHAPDRGLQPIRLGQRLAGLGPLSVGRSDPEARDRRRAPGEVGLSGHHERGQARVPRRHHRQAGRHQRPEEPPQVPRTEPLARGQVGRGRHHPPEYAPPEEIALRNFFRTQRPAPRFGGAGRLRISICRLRGD